MVLKLNLSQFVGKEVDVELRDGRIILNALVSANHSEFYPYTICSCLSYKIDGCYCEGLTPHGNDIVKIQLSTTGYNIREIEILGPDPDPANPEQGTQQTPEKANSLEPEALSTIASALTPGAIKFVESHPEYARVMQDLIIEFVEGNLGTANNELPFMIFDRMYLAKGRD
jgi:hypothetical protein